MLPLYRTPDLVIQVKDKEYLIPKALLCRFSRYIATPLGENPEPLNGENPEYPKVQKPDSSKGGRFKFFKGQKHGSSKEVNYESPGEQKSEKEAREYSSPLVDEPPPYYSTTEPVVLNGLTTRGFEILLQWLYTGHFTILGENQQSLSSLIEVARCSDLLQIAELDALIFKKTNDLLPRNTRYSSPCSMPIAGQHIYGAARLSKGHSMRCLIVKYLVSEFIRAEPFAFSKEIGETPELEEEFLAQLKVTLATAEYTCESNSRHAYRNRIVEPLCEDRTFFNPLRILQDPEKAYFVGAAALQMFK